MVPSSNPLMSAAVAIQASQSTIAVVVTAGLLPSLKVTVTVRGSEIPVTAPIITTSLSSVAVTISSPAIGISIEIVGAIPSITKFLF